MLHTHTSGILILILQLIVVVQLHDLVGGDYIALQSWMGLFMRISLDFDTNILIEAFYDPLCSDSRNSWPPLKQALHQYDSRVSFLLHLLPLSYHDNSFDACRALLVVNALNRSATFPLLESFFKYQNAVLRGVYGTPFFYVNGFLLPTQISTYNYSIWMEIIDPIGGKTSIKNEDFLHL